MRNAEFEIVRTTLPLPSPLGEGGSADPPPGGCRMRCHPERARRASRRILPRSGGCTFLLLAQKKGTKENDTREGNCGLALPVAEEARPQFPQPRHWRAVARQAREWQMRQGGEISGFCPPCGARKTVRAYANPPVFRPLRKRHQPFLRHWRRAGAFPLPGPSLIQTTKRGLRAPFGFPRDSPGNDSRFE